jgi:hypothetical protein
MDVLEWSPPRKDAVLVTRRFVRRSFHTQQLLHSENLMARRLSTISKVGVIIGRALVAAVRDASAFGK